MKGRDLVKEYVDACRAAGLKVGLYFSGPDWHFDRDYFNFLYWRIANKFKGTLPELGPDQLPRTTKHTPEEIKAHQAEYAALVRGQIEELLTRYGKIDVIRFDGAPPIPNAAGIMPVGRIRQLQPRILINPRLHGTGDFITPEGNMPPNLRLKADEWGELCDSWDGSWSYTGGTCRPLNKVLEKLVRARAAGINFLLSTGPKSDGDISADVYANIEKIGAWMKVNGEAIYGTRALQGSENASVPATSKGPLRYLYLIPPAKSSDKAISDMVSITGLQGNYHATILGEGTPLKVMKSGETVSIAIPSEVIQKPDTVRVIKLYPFP